MMIHRIIGALCSLVLVLLASPVAFSSIPQEENVSRVMKGLTSRNPKVRRDSLDKLYTLLDPNIPESRYVEISEMALEPLCALLKENDDATRWYTVNLLVKIHDARATQPLIDVLSIQVNAVGELAAEGLMNIGKPAVPQLIVALESADPISRRLAAKALGVIRDDRAVEPLLVAFRNDSSEVRRQSFEALANILGKGVLDLAAESLNDPSVRTLAALALGQHKDPRAVSYLIDVLRRDSPDVTYKAASALVSIGEPSVGQLIAVLSDQNPEYPEREVKMMIAWRKQPHLCGNEPPPPVLDPRRLAATALGEIGDERAIEPLREAMKDNSEALRANAEAALKKILSASKQTSSNEPSSESRTEGPAVIFLPWGLVAFLKVGCTDRARRRRSANESRQHNHR